MEIKKKIVAFNWTDIKHPYAGGAELMVHKHYKYWVEHGYDVSQVTSWFPGLARYEEIDGIKTYRRKRRRYLWVFGWYYFYTIFGGKADLVIDQFHGLPYFSPLWFWGKKLAVIHEVPGVIWDKTFPFPINVLGKISDWVNLWFYRFVPIWTISESTRDDLVRYGVNPKKITIIYNGANLTPLDEVTAKEKELTLLSVNRLSKMKGIEEIIQAFALVQKEVPNSKLVVVGWAEGKYPQMLKEMSEKLGIAEEVIFTGFAPSKEKLEWYRKSHILLHASVKEGWGMVVIEANTQGTPAVVYNVGGLRDSVKDGINGIIVGQNTPQALAEAVVKLWLDQKKLQRLSKSALEYSRNFPWEKFLKEGMEMIQKYI